MKQIILGVGDLAFSKDAGSMIKTHALGSCVAVMFYSYKIKAAGMVHVALPQAHQNSTKKYEKPGYFADTGIAYLLNLFKKNGIEPNNRNVWVKIAGGASRYKTDNVFNIGARNISAVRKILRELGFSIIAEDVGGTICRTVDITVDSGTITLHSHEKGTWKL